MGRLLLLGGLLLVVAIVLLPIGTMLFESVRADEVVTRSGERIVGYVTSSAPDAVLIRPASSTTTREVPRAEVARETSTFSLHHYRGVLTGAGERNMLLATLALAGASTLLAFVLGLPIGILFGATDLPFRRALLLSSVLPLALPPVFLAIAGYRDLLAVRPEFLRAVLVFGFSLFPLVALFTVRALRACGADALDAARLATHPREAFFRAALAPALPGAAVGALLAFTFVVADFAVPDFLGVTTAKNTITVYANAVFRLWDRDGNAGAAAAAGMPCTLLALLAFLALAAVERRRGGATVRGAFRELDPLPLGRWRVPALLFVLAVLALALALPTVRHLQTASGLHYDQPVAGAGTNPQNVALDPQRPTGLMDGLRRGIIHDSTGPSVRKSLLLGGGGALLAILLAYLLVELGRAAPRLDRALALIAFLPIAVPPMLLAVGWAKVFGPLTRLEAFPILLLGARLLPFASFALREARNRIDPAYFEAGALAGLPPLRRSLRIALPLLLPAAATGALLAFIFGLREVDALIFTRTGAATLPVHIYGLIHYGRDVEVGALCALWTAGLALFLIILRLLLGARLRVLP
ncbi:MAG: ABC transporter permease subunit [Planctomycetaceae bacterium]